MKWWTAALWPAALAIGQTTQISGLVLDSSGAAVPGASLTLVNQESGIRRAAESSGEGVYAIPSVRPGPYKLTLRKDGFRSMARTGLRLEVGQAARVDFTLQVGNVEEVITVESGPVQLESESASLGLLVPRAFTENLPVNGRSLLGLLDLAPGVVITPVRDPLEAGQYSVNGQRANANLISVDGMSANFGMQEESPGQALSGNLPALSAIGSLHSLLSMASIDEFKLQTSSGSAESGRFAGGLLALSTRSGGSDWHGSAQYFLRNEKLDANDWFSNNLRRARAPLRWNNFNATAGGPLRANRTFVFGSYEGFRLRQPEDLQLLVPSEAERQSGAGPFRALLPFFPAPNTSLPGPPGVGVHLGRISSKGQLDAGGLRADQVLSSRAQMFGRIYTSPSSSLRSTQRIGGMAVSDTSYRPIQVTIGAGITFGPATYLDLRGNFSRMAIEQSIGSPSLPGVQTWDPGAVFPKEAGSIPLQWRGAQFGQWSRLQQMTGRFLAQSQWQIVPSLSMVRGSHQLKFGGDYRLLRPSIREPRLTGEALFFQPDLPGLAILERREPVSLRFHNVSLWGSDTWKVHPRLTVTLGGRWEWNPPPGTRDAQPVFVVAGLDSTGAPSIESTSGALWRGRTGDIAPRLSLAWRALPSGALVLRAGSGLYYNLGTGSVLRTLTEQPSYYASATLAGLTAGAVTGLTQPAIDPLRPRFSGFSGAAPGLRTPVAMQNNITVDIASSRLGSVSGGWVNSLGRRLLRSEFSALTSGAYRYIELTTNHGSSNYHALQFQARSQEARGARLLASYTWSHAIDNGSRDSEVRLASARRTDRGSADFDVRHSVVAAFLYAPSWRRLRGWNLDGIFRARTGFPFSPFVSGWAPEPGDPTPNLEPPVYRPDYDATQPLWLFDGRIPTGRGLNPAAFPVPARRRPGSLGRNAIRGFFFQQLDLAIHRRFALGRGGAALEFRGEAFNAANTPSFAAPPAAFTPFANPPWFSPNVSLNQEFAQRGFGGNPSGGLLPAFQIGGPRSIQLSMKIQF